MRFGGVTALHDASFRVGAHEILGIIGSNGAGKTTLFDVCTGFLAPTGGPDPLGGHDVTALGGGRAGRRSGWGACSRTPACSPGSPSPRRSPSPSSATSPCATPSPARSGSAPPSGRSGAVRDRVDELIDTMGLDRYRNAFTSELSTGTRRVVEIACAMAHEPSVLLLDEPSSGIAQRESEALAELLLQLKETTGAAFVDHRARHAARHPPQRPAHLHAPRHAHQRGNRRRGAQRPRRRRLLPRRATRATIHRSGEAVHR